jgi:hypothetical protein
MSAKSDLVAELLKYRDAGRRLTPYAVLSRYPEAEDEPTKADLAVFKGTVREIFKFSKDNISAS